MKKSQMKEHLLDIHQMEGGSDQDKEESKNVQEGNQDINTKIQNDDDQEGEQEDDNVGEK